MSKTMTNKLLNFRCPPELLEAIDALGQERYPSLSTSHGCDRSKTLLDIVRAGIEALSDGSVILPAPSVPDSAVRPQQSDNLEERITAIVDSKTQPLLNAIKQLKAELGEFAA